MTKPLAMQTQSSTTWVEAGQARHGRFLVGQGRQGTLGGTGISPVGIASGDAAVGLAAAELSAFELGGGRIAKGSINGAGQTQNPGQKSADRQRRRLGLVLNGCGNLNWTIESTY